MVGGTPNVLVVAPSLPVGTVKEFVPCATGNPGKLPYRWTDAGTVTSTAGKLNPLAVAGTGGDRLVPALPACAQSGDKGFDGVQGYDMVGPAPLPALIAA